MGTPRADIASLRFGRLLALEYVGGSRWRCRCDCASTVIVSVSKLRSGHTRSCGCLQRERAVADATIHGLEGTPEHKSWTGMMSRCYTPTNPSYPRYGGRGITVCNRWRFGENGKHGFVCFLEDMGRKPSRTHSIDRHPDNNAGYGPGNCRWATQAEQQRNRRSNVIVEVRGEKMCATDAALRYGIKPAAFYDRLRRGWPMERIISEPPRPERGRRA